VREKQWQEQVVELATYCRWEHFHAYDMRRSDAGWPDLVLCRPPELIFAELKTDGGRLTPAQQGWLGRLAASGQEVYVWRPRDFEEVYARLRRAI
jgi:hypothetical protein